MSRRQSTLSNLSGHLPNPSNSTATTTSALLASLHNSFQASVPYSIDASTSLVIVSALGGGNGRGTMMSGSGIGSPGAETVDTTLTARAWEHARRRAEDQCIVVGSLSPATTPSLLAPLLSSFPQVPPFVLTILDTIRPFITALSPLSPQTPLHFGLVLTQHISLAGDVTGCSIALSPRGIDIQRGLLKIPNTVGYRAFDVFYYLLSATSSPQEREFLSLEEPQTYKLLRRSGTYSPPAWLPTADDAAQAEDFRQGLRDIGIKGSLLRGVLSILAGLLKLGNTLSVLDGDDEVNEICEDVGGLLGLEPEVLVSLGSEERERFIAATYEALVNWVISKANTGLESEFESKRDGSNASSQGDTVAISLVEIPNDLQAKAVCLRMVFDDDVGLNAEMREDGLESPQVNSAVLREMRQSIQDLEGDSLTRREEEYERDRKEGVVEKVGREVESGGFLQTVLFPQENGVKIEKHEISAVLSTSRVWYHLSLSPNDMASTDTRNNTPSMSLSSQTAGWSAAAVSKQVRSWRLMEWSNRRNKHLDFTADYDFDEMAQRYSSLGCFSGRDGVESWVMERGWSNGEVFIGKERVWMREGSWWEAESMLDLKPGMEMGGMAGITGNQFVETPGSFPDMSRNNSGFFPPMGANSPYHDNSQTSRDNLILGGAPPGSGFINRPMSVAPPLGGHNSAYGLGDVKYDPAALKDEEVGKRAVMKKEKQSALRRFWVAIIWALTFWIPSPALRYIGGMKRPDVRFAWREKFVLFFFIIVLNAAVVFYIVGLGNVLCPGKNKVWNVQEVSYHQGDNDFYVAIHGRVYDISKFWRTQHSDVTSNPASSALMKDFAGLELSSYFPPPLTVACPGLVTDQAVQITQNVTNQPTIGNAIHKSGPYQQIFTSSKLNSIDWYAGTFVPKINQYYKGDVVIKQSTIASEGVNQARPWFILNGKVYDLTDYMYSVESHEVAGFNNTNVFFDDEFTQLVTDHAGEDITAKYATIMSTALRANTLNCLNNAFYSGKIDFRVSARCTANNWILLSFAVMLCVIIGIKFIAALQFGSRKRPSMQDKFVICQVPCYTEGEDSLRKAIDSLTALNYENKRKLLFLICDGIVTGGGNDKDTPQIVLDILGVDPKVSPPALPFKSVGEGSLQLNYGKVYSGLYEFEGRVVPYIVVVKVGNPNESQKPGNRGKRDSQVLLMSFLNRVHHRTPMSPLELELFHQINNVIGVDPELYEYLLMVDADTSVREDSLNRLVAACANNAKIAGICGETSLENEERSWWTMIQVYEYFISHHLSKAFESLFGSVTCLPGCFSMYRLRTADKGKPLIISSKVIEDYSEGNVDTLHKKNLFSLGEDRYLTTLMTKHFPYMSYKFIPDAYAMTAAPETWSVLLSQRRRWINSTIHNLGELIFLKEMCGFCFFSMRFIVFIDLAGTILLPSTCGYLAYLIYSVAAKKGAFPLISIIMIAAVYGLQALIFLMKRQWQHIGWMIIYILAYPIYSFVLPLYSFWKQDDFSWGSTRIVVGEKGDTKIIATEDEGFDPASVPLQAWDEYATLNNLPGRRTAVADKYYDEAGDRGYEMDDMQSVYSSVKPASTLHFGGNNPYLQPAPSPLGHRQSSYSSIGGDHKTPGVQSRQMSMMSLGAQSEHWHGEGGLAPGGDRQGYPPQRSPLGNYGASRPASSVLDFTRVANGPDDANIIEVIRDCLSTVDLDNVTKKQVRALVEQRLQTELSGERRAFMDRAIDAELAAM